MLDAAFSRVLVSGAVLGALLGLAACSSGGADGGTRELEEVSSPERRARVRLLVEDAPSDELVSFSAIVEGAVLEYADGTESSELLASPLRVEFLGLRERPLWIVDAPVVASDVAAVRLAFAPESFEARARTGERLRVDAPMSYASYARATFLRAIAVTEEELATFVLDLDLSRSLTGNPMYGELDFTPRATVRLERGRSPIQELDGLVLARDPAGAWLEVAPFADQDRTVALAPLRVRLDDRALLVDALGQVSPFAPQFLADLVPGAAVVELFGELDAGGLWAHRVELEDLNGVLGQAFPIKLEGRITEVVGAPGRRLPTRLSLALSEVERGRALFEGALAGLGDPLEVAIGLDARTNVFEGGALWGLADLVPGLPVKIELRGFAAAPFPAATVEVLQPGPRWRGSVSSRVTSRRPTRWSVRGWRVR